MKVLLASHIGKPWGGISVQNELLLNSGLRDLVNLQSIATSAGNIDFDARGKWKLPNVLNTIDNLVKFVKTFQSVKPDIVDIGTAYGTSFFKHSLIALYAHYHHSKVIITFHCSINKIFTGMFFINKFAEMIISKCDGVSVISQEWLAIKNYFPKQVIQYIPNAINTSDFSSIKREKKSNVNQCVNILYLGHIGEEKGIYDLIEAVSILVNNRTSIFVFNLVGNTLENGEKETIQDLIKLRNLDKYIKMYSSVYGEAKFECLSKADILVLPSYHEGMPMSIIEGMAAGLPVVASFVGGIPDEVINGVTGLLFAPHDITNLTKALNKLIGDEDLRITMGLAGRQRAIDLFDINKKVNSLFEFYNEILSNQTL